MNKKLLIAIFAFILVIVLIIFGFKSCNTRTKVISSEAEEYSAFINANIEFTCMVMKDPKLAENSAENQQKLNNVYAKYKLPISNNAQMLNILQKYENNTNVAAIIQENTMSCLQGGSPIFYQAAT